MKSISSSGILKHGSLNSADKRINTREEKRHSKADKHLSGNEMLKSEAAKSFFNIYYKGAMTKQLM